MAAAPPLLAPQFGVYLRQLRGDRALQDVAYALRASLPVPMKLSPTVVRRYERGQVPPWAVLVAYAATYAVPLPNLTGRLTACLQAPDGRDLGCHAGGVQSPDAPLDAPTRLQLDRLEADNAQLRADLARIADIAGELLAVAVRARKADGAGVSARTARPRGRRRG